ncbi:PhzF family phenazine biosynthesis protein [Paraburkholderia bryophila]|uniref:PhzF family phenazine biosynthesis protein n=1 Tax=Paraburkholderia bryophila TaxID=420952 RepID=A0A7Z0AZV9_9BURK|nr:PhzF family phenazine biosynthesis protein [Paraburkholderia bryophila]NYH14737.1 PhzF family phenazine biosynthesis protein [Paraburkholderia bryophila]
MKLHRMLCFGRHEGTGNAAIVVEHAALAEAERLAFAREQNAAATVFVETNAAGETQLDYFYPHMRSPLCLHATLAASAVFFERNPEIERTRFVTSLRGQVLEVTRLDQSLFVEVSPQRCPPLSVDVDVAARLLQTDPANLIGLPRLASVGSAKLLVEVADQPLLDALQPDLPAIVSWGREQGVSGLYVYCRLHDEVYAGRNFNHLEPHAEDPATGVAAGALASLLERDITVLQGDALGQPCTLQARYTNGTVQVGGRAERSEI